MPDIQKSHYLLNRLLNFIYVGIASQPQDKETKIPISVIYFSLVVVKCLVHKVEIINWNETLKIWL